MNNQEWSKAELNEWKKFWESDMGGKALEKMNQIREMLYLASMNARTTDEAGIMIARAAGITMVLDDIQVGIQAAEKENEKEDKKAKK